MESTKHARRPRDVARYLHTRNSTMTIVVATRTSAQSADFDIVSIVPTISMAWTTLPTVMITASDMWAMRHFRGANPNRRRSAAKNATAKIAHIAVTPKGENGVGDIKRRASIMSGGLVIHKPATWTTTNTTSVPPIKKCATAADRCLDAHTAAPSSRPERGRALGC
jgi:hypothetical protein